MARNMLKEHGNLKRDGSKVANVPNDYFDSS